MRARPLHHIVDIYSWVCEAVPDGAKPHGGRPNCLRDSELLTLVIWNAVTETFSPNLAHLRRWIRTYHLGRGREVLRLPKYPGFVAQMHRLEPKLWQLLGKLLSTGGQLRFADSTMLEVCQPVRADHCRSAAGVARFGRNHQGWHLGFKLHVACTPGRALAATVLTPANEADVQQLPFLANRTTRAVVADAGYTSGVMRRRIWRDYRCAVVSPPRPRQVWTATPWQLALLRARPKVEAVFAQLKGRMHLASSLPRSVRGYATHYARVLLGYQAWVVGF